MSMSLQVDTMHAAPPMVTEPGIARRPTPRITTTVPAKPDVGLMDVMLAVTAREGSKVIAAGMVEEVGTRDARRLRWAACAASTIGSCRVS
jgi:hypothetical protein